MPVFLISALAVALARVAMREVNFQIDDAEDNDNDNLLPDLDGDEDGDDANNDDNGQEIFDILGEVEVRRLLNRMNLEGRNEAENNVNVMAIANLLEEHPVDDINLLAGILNDGEDQAGNEARNEAEFNG